MFDRDLSAGELAAYEQDGVIRLKAVIGPDWIDRLNRVVDSLLERPGKWANDASPGARSNRLFTDRYLWRDNPDIRAYVFESGLGRLAAQAMRSSAARFYFDHILVKEPQTTVATPWHQDVPYWPFLGTQICSIWVALTDATVEQSAMEFVRGSHADGRYYLPQVFGDRDNHPNDWARSAEGEPVPPIEEHRQDYDIIGWDMEAGDAVLFSAWLLHGAPGNRSTSRRRAAISTRWLGDDAVWYPHPGADPTVTQDDVTSRPGEPAADDRVFPVVWPRAG
jgi:ectoine hydroxylase-related dioxygenase (phytanoyl-CoA dioxygenase family)